MKHPLDFRALRHQFGGVTLPAAPDTIIHEDNLVARNGAGQAIPAADTAGLLIAGVGGKVDNSGSPADGRNKVGCALGIFRFRNSTAAPVTVAELGKPVYVEDSRTVASITTHSVVAGVAIGLDNATTGTAVHVWLAVGPVGTLPGTVTLGSV